MTTLHAPPLPDLHAHHSTTSIPSVGAVVPYDMALDSELRRFSQDSRGLEQVNLLFTRTPFQPLAVTVEQAREISRPEVIAETVRTVAATGPSVYFYGCTSGSFVRGVEGERRLTATIAEAGRDAAEAAAFAVDTAATAYPAPEIHPTGEATDSMVHAGLPPAVTTSGALLEAIQGLGLHTISAATPYDAGLGAVFSRFFAEAEIHVAHTAHLGLSGRIWTVDEQSIYELIRRSDTDQAEAVVVSCTNLPTAGLLDQLEQDLGKPVISANQATVWATLARCGLRYQGPGAALRGLPGWAPGTTHPVQAAL